VAGNFPQGGPPTRRGTPPPARHAHRDRRSHANGTAYWHNKGEPPIAGPAPRPRGAAGRHIIQ